MATATTIDAIASATDVLRMQGQVIHRILRLNTEGLTQEDSLIQPQPAGNCLNWNVGHLVWTNEQILSILQQPPVLGEPALERYARGSRPLCDPAEALPLEQLLSAWIPGGLASTQRWSTLRRSSSPHRRRSPRANIRKKRLAACCPSFSFTRLPTPARQLCCAPWRGSPEPFANQ